MPRAAHIAVRLTALLGAGAAVAVVLAGCVDADAPTPTPSGTSAPAPSPSPTVDPTTEPQPEALDLACTDLVSLDTMYAFDPNFALLDSFTPDAGTAAAEAVADGGVACRWVRESGGVTIDLSVARLSAGALTELKNEAFDSSTMVPTYGEEAYFDPATGTATVFQGSDWLVLRSEAFAEPGEATDLVESALAALATA